MQRMIVLFFLVTIFLVNGVEAKSLKKGEVYSLLSGKGTIEVISKSELEISKEGRTTLAKYGFKDDKLRAVIGDEIIYFEITKEGLKEEKTGAIYYSKSALAKVRAEEEKQRKL